MTIVDASFGGPSVACVVLAGGGGTRLGGVFKPGISLAGASLLQNVVEAARESFGGDPAASPRGPKLTGVVVVGDPALTRLALSGSSGVGRQPRSFGDEEMFGATRLFTVADDRPGSGPAHGFMSGLLHAPSSDWVCLLTGDLVDNVQHGCRVLSGWLETHHPENDRCGAVLMDRGGRPQWGVSLWRRDEIRTQSLDNKGRLSSILPVDRCETIETDREVRGLNTADELLDMAFAASAAGPVRIRLIDAHDRVEIEGEDLITVPVL